MHRDTRANAYISDSWTPLTQFMWLGLQVANVLVRLWQAAYNRLTVTRPDNRYRRVTGTMVFIISPRWYTKMIYKYISIYLSINVYKYRLNTAGKKNKVKEKIDEKKQHSVYILQLVIWKCEKSVSQDSRQSCVMCKRSLTSHELYKYPEYIICCVDIYNMLLREKSNKDSEK